ncbi:vomeronasal type-2 receptor 26-like [Leptodactylus fuscus]
MNFVPTSRFNLFQTLLDVNKFMRTLTVKKHFFKEDNGDLQTSHLNSDIGSTSKRANNESSLHLNFKEQLTISTLTELEYLNMTPERNIESIAVTTSNPSFYPISSRGNCFSAFQHKVEQELAELERTSTKFKSKKSNLSYKERVALKELQNNKEIIIKKADKGDMDKCEQCPEDEWPNSRNSACLKRPLDFLSFQDVLGILLILLIVILYVCSVIILVIFITYRETPIVKGNNRDLSYTILISLMLSFLCSLLFIGNPTRLTCLLQNIIFNLIFTVAVSSILAKTITVLIAFNVTKPRSRFRLRLRKMSHVFIVFCFIGELGICICWLHFYPPYPARDSVSKPGILILYCNVGSHVIFYLALGYNSFFALLCFLVAYFAKKLPDRFNEALHITFSMLVFCSVWISFIPAYVSTKGKFMTATQVFAILASSTGLLGLIFFPKCFIIIFRPELNIKTSLYIRS